MADFPLIGCLKHDQKVKLLELYSKLGGNVKLLDAQETAKEEAWGSKPTQVFEDIDRLMRQAPHYAGKPG